MIASSLAGVITVRIILYPPSSTYKGTVFHLFLRFPLLSTHFVISLHFVNLAFMTLLFPAFLFLLFQFCVELQIVPRDHENEK